MASPFVKNALTFGISGAAGVASFSIGRALTKPSIVSVKDKILSSYKDDFSKFLSTKDRYWGDIKKEYEKDGAVNKPIHNGKIVDTEDLPYGCAAVVDSAFDEKDYSKLDSALRGCYINTNSFRAQVTALKKELRSTGADNDSSGQTAGENTYKSLKNDERGKISDGSNDLNADDKAKGASALKGGCSDTSTITMFSNEAKSVFRKFEKFCLKDKVN